MDYPSLPHPRTPTEERCAENIRRKNKKKPSGGGPTTKLSTDPQSVAARRRRHRISHRFKILQSLVPGGSKMDTVSMLEEAINYVKFLKNQISWLHQQAMASESVLPTNHQHHQEFDMLNDSSEDQVRTVIEDSWFQFDVDASFNA